jgi:hypothetical protein
MIISHDLSNGKGIDGANWIRLAQDRVRWREILSMVMNLWVPYESRLLFDKLSNYCFSKNTLHHAVSK